MDDGFDGPDRERAAIARTVRDGFNHPGRSAQELLGMRKQLLAGFGERDRPLVAFKQSDAKLGLERGDPRGHGRLR